MNRWIGTGGPAFVAASLSAQDPVKPPLTKADSAAQAVADSIALVRKFEQLQSSNAQVPPAAPAPTGGAQGSTNPRMLPDFSAVGDLVGDLTGEGSTQADGTRFGVREVEIAVQSAVDPYFRGDIFLGISALEGISIEQAFLTATSLPWGLQAQLGRFLMPVSKQNTTHRHDLHTVEYPYVIQRYLSDDGLKGTGVAVSKIFSPFGFYQELIVGAVDRFGERDATLTAVQPANRRLDGMGFSARFRNYVDLSQSANVELSASAMTGMREQLMSGTGPGGENAVNARQSVYGVDFTYRWRPLQQGLYSSFILQAEAIRQVNGAPDAASVTAGPYTGPGRDFAGGYVFARWQLSQRLYLGGRFDSLEDPALGGANFRAGSLVLEWFPSEFSKLVAQFEHTQPQGMPALNRLLLQATFAMGPHKPHPF